MEIIKDTKIRDRWHAGFKRELNPHTVVLHGTGGGGTYNWVLQGGRKEQYKRGIALFHYLIERDGATTEIIDPDRWVYHSSSGQFDSRTIGIELVNPSPTNNSTYTENQYKSLFDLIFFELFERYPIIQIMSHNKAKEIYSGGNKVCPGKFDWDRLEQEMFDAGYTFTKNVQQYTDIQKRDRIEEELKNMGELL